jgi:hypothetical protein
MNLPTQLHALSKAAKTLTALPLPKGIEVGQAFSDLTVVGRVPSDKHGRVQVLCNCVCGTPCEVRLSDLKSGHTQSCGCKRVRSIRHRLGRVRFVRFGQFAAMGKAHPERGATTKSTEWVVFCDYCGEMAIAKTSELRRGKKRCPCIESTYNSWRDMIQRCTNPNHEQYAGYGGKGVYVCDEWFKSFQKFLSDMGPRPEGKTLDRYPDPKGPYMLKNCRWATPKEQAESRG